MRWYAAALAIGLAAPVRAQPPAQREPFAAHAESARVVDDVRRRPNQANDRIRDLIAQASRTSLPESDSLIHEARRLAEAYALAWNDSFTIAYVDRFQRLATDERLAKVRADSLRRAGNSAFGSQGIARAMLLWRRALRAATALHDTASIAATLGNIGVGFYRASDVDSAVTYLTAARRLADAIGDRRTALNALAALGSVAQEQHDLARAYEIHNSALELRRRIGDVRGEAADHTNLGLIDADLGDLGGAERHYTMALRIARENELTEAAATALLNLGNVASTEGRFAIASQRYSEAMALYDTLHSVSDMALVNHNLGLLGLRRGDYATAERHLRDARRVFERVGTIDDLVQVCRDLAAVETARGNLRAALQYLSEAERLVRAAPSRPDLTAAVALAGADLAIELNAFDNADRQYERAESYYRRAGDRVGEANALTGRAMLLLERKQYARAIEALELAERATRPLADRRANALAALALGYARLRQGDSAQARRLLGRARDSLRAVDDPVSEAVALASLGDMELESGAPLNAEEHYRQALSRVGERTAPSVSWQLHERLGRALRRRGALDAASAELRRAIGDAERVAGNVRPAERRAMFLSDKWDAYAELALVEEERGDGGGAFDVSERMRAREMLETFARGRINIATRDSALLQRQQDLRAQIDELTERLAVEEKSAASLRGSEPSKATSAATRQVLSRAEDEYAQLLIEMRDVGGPAAEIANPVSATWRDVAKRLRKSEALISYLITDSSSIAFVVTHDTIVALPLAVRRTELAASIQFARGAIARPRGSVESVPWRAPLRHLYLVLCAPIVDGGLLTGVDHLIIVPSAELHYLPFAALIRQDERHRDQFLIQRYDIGYAPSASVWLRLSNRPALTPSRVLALAPRSRELPGSRDEVAGIGVVWGRQATVLTDAAATEESLADVTGYDVLHLATYGVLNPRNPLFSFVQLSRGVRSDGRLEVHEVLALSLHARLVVLSACQTALASGAIADVPAGDDWVGLVRAFLTAGAQNVVATLWPVEDRSTAVLMQQFHNRLHDGTSEVSALAQVQREAIRNNAVSSPFYWAGFVLVGGP